MKALIIAADALIPEYILGNNYHLFPNISKLIDNGASSQYSAYVQRNYNGHYSSEQNWASIYTGLSPSEHNIDRRIINGKEYIPKMGEFNNLEPFWKLLNDNGYSVGLFQPDCCDEPIPIDGYCVTSMYSPIFTPSENRTSKRHIQLCDKDKWILDLLNDEPPPRVYPKTLKQLGYTFSQLKSNPDLVDQMHRNYSFSEIIENFHDELSYWLSAIINIHSAKPVDVAYFFTPSTDIIPHFVLYEDNCNVLIDCYKALDIFIGELIKKLKPENVIIISDHGQENFSNLVKCSDPKIQHEAFSKNNEALWLNNGYIAFEAMNGGLLLTTHSLKGVFIACGNNINHTIINEMRTLDIYPTLLEIFMVKAPTNRSGYVMDIFDRSIVNSNKLIKAQPHKRIALIQSHEINISDIFINEIYLENRFSDIIIIGEEKYREIFLNNPRVIGFASFEEYDNSCFDKVFCGYYNKTTEIMMHVRIC